MFLVGFTFTQIGLATGRGKDAVVAIARQQGG
jgi:pilus assembly protein Flp/PilA